MKEWSVRRLACHACADIYTLLSYGDTNVFFAYSDASFAGNRATIMSVSLNTAQQWLFVAKASFSREC